MEHGVSEGRGQRRPRHLLSPGSGAGRHLQVSGLCRTLSGSVCLVTVKLSVFLPDSGSVCLVIVKLPVVCTGLCLSGDSEALSVLYLTIGLSGDSEAPSGLYWTLSGSVGL